MEVPFLAFTTLINNIFVPLAAIASISSNCFNNALVQAPSVEDNYPVVLCAVYRADNDLRKFECSETYLAVYTASYDPPFIYTYQCASTMFLNFSAVFVYMLIITGLLLPTAKLVLRFYAWQEEKQEQQALEAARLGGMRGDRLATTRATATESAAVAAAYPETTLAPSRFRSVLCRVLPAVLQPVRASSEQSEFRLFLKEKVVVRFVAMLGTLLAFGAVFPPIVLIVGASFCYITYVEEFLLASILYQADRLGFLWFRLQLLVDVQGLRPLFYTTLWQVMPFALLLFAYLLFDTLGYSHGWKTAVMPTFFALAAWSVLIAIFPTSLRIADNRWGWGWLAREGMIEARKSRRKKPLVSVEGHEMLPSTFSQLWFQTNSPSSHELEDSLRVQRGTLADPSRNSSSHAVSEKDE